MATNERIKVQVPSEKIMTGVLLELRAIRAILTKSMDNEPNTRWIASSLEIKDAENFWEKLNDA